jgi:predicted transcriptional regulator
VRAQLTEDRQENMSDIRSERRRIKELQVLELHDKGLSSRKIASLVHLSLRDVTKYIERVSNKTRSPSTTSVMDEVVLEYRVNGLRRQVRDLNLKRENLLNEVDDLRAQKYNFENQLRAKQSELETKKFSEILNDILPEDQL